MKIIDLLDRLPIGMILIKSDGTILDMNQYQEGNSGLKREDVIGRNIQKVYPRFFKIKKARRLYTESIREKKAITIRLPRYRAQYRDIITELVVNMLPITEDEFLIVIFNNKDVYDIKKTLRKKESKLKLSNQLMRSIIDSSPNIVLVLDSKFRIKVANLTAIREFKVESRDIIGKYLKDFINPSYEFIHSPPDEYEVDFFTDGKRSDGSIFPMEATVNPIDGFEKRLFLFIGKNIEERRRLEERIAEMERLAMMGEISSSIMHRIMNPMVGVTNTIELLLEENNLEKKNRLAESAHRSAMRILEVLKTMSHCSETRLCIREWVKLEDVEKDIQDLFKRLSMDNPNKDMKILMVKRHHHDKVFVDRARLVESIENILRNSMDETVNASEIALILTLHNGIFIVEIRDNGRGMTEAEIKNITKPFYSTKAGMGMGLYLARRIIEEHGGDLQIESELGRGTTVKLLVQVL